MSNMYKKEKKNIRKITQLGVTTSLILSSFSPVIYANENELVPISDDEKSSFIYRKQKNKGEYQFERNIGGIYMLKLKKGVDKNGEEFTPTKEQIKQSYIPVYVDEDGKYKAEEVKYRGIYELVQVTRAPGYFAYNNPNMHINSDDIEKGFEFPQEIETTEVQLKEELLLPELELLLQNKHKRGLNGKFKITKIADPGLIFPTREIDSDIMYDLYMKSPYMNYNRESNIHIEDQIEVFKDIMDNKDKNVTAAGGDKYKTAEESYNQVATSFEVNDGEGEEVGIIETKEGKIAEYIISKDWAENERKGLGDKRLDLTEGIYEIEQIEFEDNYESYGKNNKGYFAISVDETGQKPILLVHSKITANTQDYIAKNKLFSLIKENIFGDNFKRYDHIDYHDDELYFLNQMYLDKSKSLYQAILINSIQPGYRPGKPNEDKSSYKSFNKGAKRPADINNFDDLKYLEEQTEIMTNSEKDENARIKINRGEKFDLNFEFAVPDRDNLKKYSQIVFQDLIDSGIVLPAYTSNELSKYIDVKFLNDKNEDVTDTEESPMKYCNMSVEVEEVGDAHSVVVKLKNGEGGDEEDPGEEEDLWEDEEEEEDPGIWRSTPLKSFKNQMRTSTGSKIEKTAKSNAFNDYKVSITIKDVYVKTDQVDDIHNEAFLFYNVYDEDNVAHPEVYEKVKVPKKSKGSFDHEKITKIDTNDPDLIKTPTITIDPITTNFRVGVVDQTTNLLDDSVYELKSFKPTRGEGKLNKDGKIEIDGNIFENIPTEIDVSSESFISLDHLPAGEYIFVEKESPVGKNDRKPYRLVEKELRFVVQEDEDTVTINGPIVKNGSEVLGTKDISTLDVYKDIDFKDHSKVVDGDAMIHHFRYIDAPETGTLARAPFFIGGSIIVAAGAYQMKKKKN